MTRRCIALLLLLLVLVPAAAGCHGRNSGGAFKVPDGLDPDRNYTVRFWAKNDTNYFQAEIYSQAIRDFEELYPNIRIEMTPYTDYGQIYRDVITNIGTGTTPNVCISYPDHIATYKTGQDIVVPLDSLVSDPKYGLGGSELRFDGPIREEIVPKFLNECYIDSSLYLLPYMRSSEACYMNQDMIEKLGYTVPDVLTWDWIFEVSEAAMKKDAEGNFLINGQKTLIPFIYKSTDNMMITMLKQRGAPYSTDKGDIEIFNPVTREILLGISEHAATGAFSTFAISSYPANYLNRGQCIFCIDSTAGSTWVGAESPNSDIHGEGIPFTVAVRMIPQYDPEHPVMISQGPSLCLFNKKDSGEVLASWLFMQFLLSNSVQIPYAKTEGYIPVTAKAQGDPEYQDYLARGGEDAIEHYSVKIETTKLFLDHVDDTFITPVFNGSASLRNVAGQLIENVTKSRRRKEPVDDAYLTQMFQDVSKMYHLSQYGKMDLGAMPSGSVALIVTLGAVWTGILAFLIVRKVKAKRPAGQRTSAPKN